MSLNMEDNNVTFGNTEYNTESNQEKVDTAKYTVIDADHLDEDEIIANQRYCLLSFMSPEGIMNCNVRSVKFRGAYATLEEAEKYAAKLEQQDRYFKIFVGETGKWLDCDPNSKRVEQEKTSNPQHQQIINAQNARRMAKINELAGRTKHLIDKNRNGKKDMMNEKKKEGAAQELIDKKRQQQKTNDTKPVRKPVRKSVSHGSNTKLEAMKERMRQKIAKKQELNNINKTPELNNKIAVISKQSMEVANNKAKLEKVDRNIEKIKQLMANKRNN